jgi:hypothetical protein
LSAFGWTVAKVAVTTPYWRGRIGATARSTAAQAASYIDAATGPVQGTGSGATTAGDSFRSDNPLNGTFAAGNWNFTFGMRTGAATNAGRIRCNMWASVNADGSSARKLNAATLVGTTVTMNSITATFNSTITWNAPQIILNNEYVFLQPEWNSTTAGTSNSCTAQFYQCSFVTTNYVYAIPAVSGETLPPVLSQPGLGQNHVFSGDAAVAGSPILEAPELTRIAVGDVLNATSLAVASPDISSDISKLVGAFTPGADRNNFTGRVGMRFSPASNTTYSKIGLRCGTNNTGLHTLYLYDWGTGGDADGVPLGAILRTTTVDLTGATVGSFYYTDIDPITLTAGAKYLLAAQVTSGDLQQWADNGPVTLQGAQAGSIFSAFTADNINHWTWQADKQYHGVDLAVSNAPILQQQQVLQAIALSASPILAAAILEQQHVLPVPNNAVAGSPALGIPTAGITVTFNPGSVVAGVPTLGTPSLAVTVNATAIPLTVGALTFGTPAVGSFVPNIVLSPSGFALAPTYQQVIPAFGTTAIVYHLSVTGFAVGIPVLGQGLFKQTHALATLPLAVTSPVPGVGILGQVGVMSATPLVVGVPTLGQPTFGQKHVLASASLTDSVPVVAAITLRQTHLLAATAAAAGLPALGQAVFGQHHVVTAAAVAAAVPTLGVGILGQSNILAATALAVGAPTFGAAVSSIIGVMAGMPITVGLPVIGVGLFGQKHVVTAQALVTSTPVLGSSALGKVLSATALAVGAPVFGTPSLTKALTAAPLAVGVPILGQPALVAVVTCIATPLITAAPVVGIASLAQQLPVSGFAVGAPIFGAPILTKTLVAAPLAAGVPALGTPAIVGVAGLTSISFTVTVPAFSTPAFGQAHKFTTSLSIGPPLLPVLTLGVIGVMAATPLAVGAPVLGAPVFGQRQVLLPAGASAGVPSFTAPALLATAHPIAPALEVGAPVFDQPALGQQHALIATDLVVAPIVGQANMGVIGIMSCVPLIVGAPIFGTPVLKPNLLAYALVVGKPSLTAPVLHQVHALPARGFNTGLLQLGRPVLGRSHILYAVNLVGIPPELSRPLIAGVPEAVWIAREDITKPWDAHQNAHPEFIARVMIPVWEAHEESSE